MGDKCEYLYIGGMRIPIENVLVTVTRLSTEGSPRDYLDWAAAWDIDYNRVRRRAQSFRVATKSPGKDRGEPPMYATIKELKKLLKDDVSSTLVSHVYDPKTKSPIGEPFGFNPSKAQGHAGRRHATKEGRSAVWLQFAKNEFVAGLLAKGVSYGASKGLDTINTGQMDWLARTPAGQEVLKKILKSSDPGLNDVKYTLAAAIDKAKKLGTSVVLSKEDLESFAKLVPMAEALGFSKERPTELASTEDEKLRRTMLKVESPEDLASIVSRNIRTVIEQARAADLANHPLPPDPFTGGDAPVRPTRVPDRIVDALGAAVVRAEFVTGIVSDDGSESAMFTAALEHIEPEQAMHMMTELQDVLRELDRLDVINMIPGAAGVPGGVFHVDAQRLSPQEYDRVLEAMKEFFLSLDPESAPARTGSFASLMGPRPVGLTPAPVPTPTGPTATPVLSVSEPVATEPVEPELLTETGGDDFAAIRLTLESLRACARRGIAESGRSMVYPRRTSVYTGDFFNEILDLRNRSTGLPPMFVSILDNTLTVVNSRPGVILAQEVLDVVSKLTDALPSA